MADPAHELRHRNAAEREADAIGGADEADGAGRKSFGQASQRDIGSLQAVAADQNAAW